MPREKVPFLPFELGNWYQSGHVLRTYYSGKRYIFSASHLAVCGYPALRLLLRCVGYVCVTCVCKVLEAVDVVADVL